MPCDHQTFQTREAAEEVLAIVVRKYKRSGKGGKSWKRLNVYPCGNHFHIGRANKLPTNYQKPEPAPAPKPLSTGELRRKLERMAESWQRHDDYLRRQRAEELGRIIAADLLNSESELPVAVGSIDDLEDSVAIARRLVR